MRNTNVIKRVDKVLIRSYFGLTESFTLDMVNMTFSIIGVKGVGFCNLSL